MTGSLYQTVLLLWIGFLCGWIVCLWANRKAIPEGERNAYEWEIAELSDALEEEKKK